MKMATRMMAAPAHPLGVNRSPRTTTAVAAAKAGSRASRTAVRDGPITVCAQTWMRKAPAETASPVSRSATSTSSVGVWAAGRRRQYEGEGRGDEELNRSERDNRVARCHCGKRNDVAGEGDGASHGEQIAGG